VQLLVRIIFILLPLISFASAADAQQSAAEVKQRLEGVQAQIRAKRARFTAVQGEVGDLEAELAKLETRVGNVARELDHAALRLQVEHARLQALDQRKHQQLDELARQRTALAGQVRAAYAMGRQEKLKLLLNQQDPEAVGRMLVYFNYINRARKQLIDGIKQDLFALSKLGDQINTQRGRLESVARQLRVRKTELESTRARRAGVLAKLKKEAETTGQSLAALVQNEGALQRLLTSIQEALADIPKHIIGDAAFNKLKGNLPWPSSGPIVNHFGEHHSEAADMLWQGVTIGARIGAEVHAVSGGRVVFADWMRGFGLLAIIDHGDGYMSLYAHNQSLYKRVGEWVEAGELIAKVGDSGGQTDSGLYFEIRHQGKPVDPAAWCKGENTLANSNS
jgi:murein hydrolase activator